MFFYMYKLLVCRLLIRKHSSYMKKTLSRHVTALERHIGLSNGNYGRI